MSETFSTSKIDLLIRQRESLGLSQRELEEKLGVSQRMVAKWESGRRSPTAANLDRWCEALGLRLVFVKVKA